MNKIQIVIISLFCAHVLQAQIKTVTLRTEHPVRYERVDLDVELVARWNNPFLQEEVALDMVLKSPEGKELSLPCYYESGDSKGVSLWKARFAPQESGLYTYRFRLAKGGKAVSFSKSQTFHASPSDQSGFLHTNDPWTLRFDNGQPFRGVGENICWESRADDDSKYFKKLHEMASIYNYEVMLPDFAGYGGNFFRTWMCSWNLPIDFKKGFNNDRYAPSDAYYNPSAVERMDQLVELSEKLRLYMMLTLGPGAYLTRDGGTVSSAADFFIDTNAKARYKNRLRYIVGRWGYSPSIAMWEFFNEVDNVQYGNKEKPIPGSSIVDWHKEMSAYLKQIDPYEHIVTTSISHRDIEGLNSIPDIDINQKHIYNKTAILASEIRKYTDEFKKPYIIGEFGYEWDWSKNFNDFAYGMEVDFKRGLWYGIFSPTPVLPMSWWWEFFDNRGTNAYFRGVREISDRMLKAGNGSFESVVVEAEGCDAYGVKCGNEVFVYVYNPTSSVWISAVNIRVTSTSGVTIQGFEPTNVRYTDVIGPERTPDQITLKQVAIGSGKEMVYIVNISR